MRPFRLEPKSEMRTKMPKLLGVFILLLLVVQIIVSNRLANFGSHLSQVENEISTLTEANQQLEEKIASSSSLMAVADKAKQLGFTKNMTPVYLSRDVSVARIIK